MPHLNLQGPGAVAVIQGAQKQGAQKPNRHYRECKYGIKCRNKLKCWDKHPKCRYGDDCRKKDTNCAYWHPSDRLARCKLIKSATGFHQTCVRGADGIEKAGRFKRGKDGLAGGGIYMAVCEQDTHHKAHHFGVLFTCTVYLGRVKKLDANGDQSITFWRLWDEGYDSVEIARPGGKEYVVYNYDQIANIQRVNGFQPQHHKCNGEHK